MHKRRTATKHTFVQFPVDLANGLLSISLAACGLGWISVFCSPPAEADSTDLVLLDSSKDCPASTTWDDWFNIAAGWLHDSSWSEALNCAVTGSDFGVLLLRLKPKIFQVPLPVAATFLAAAATGWGLTTCGCDKYSFLVFEGKCVNQFGWFCSTAKLCTEEWPPTPPYLITCVGIFRLDSNLKEGLEDIRDHWLESKLRSPSWSRNWLSKDFLSPELCLKYGEAELWESLHLWNPESMPVYVGSGLRMDLIWTQLSEPIFLGVQASFRSSLPGGGHTICLGATCGSLPSERLLFKCVISWPGKTFDIPLDCEGSDPETQH